MGPQVYFNSFVRIEGQLVKYGVIRGWHLQEEMATWKHLYVSGRLQKPVHVVQPNETFEKAVL
jgi:translocator assembly and maintenance protein 41